jgi:N-terminal half of MaoC dehydratase
VIDRRLIGHQFESFTTTVEKSRLIFFAKAIGETNPVYTYENAARAAGHRALPAPPTYPFILASDGPEFMPVLQLLELDISRLLHGTQDFEYLAPIYAGDSITVRSHISNMYERKGGAMLFIVQEYSFTNQDGELVAIAKNTAIYNNAGA